MLKAMDDDDDNEEAEVRVAIRPPMRSGSSSNKRSAPARALRCCGQCLCSGAKSVLCCLPRMFAAFVGPCICVLALIVVVAVVLSGVSLYQVQHGASTLTTTAVDAASHWLGSWLSGGTAEAPVLLRFNTVAAAGGAGDAWASPPIPSMVGWVGTTGVLEATVRGYPLDQVGDLVLLARNESLSGAAARRYVTLPLDVRLEPSARVILLRVAAVLSLVRATETPFLILYRVGTAVKDYDTPSNVLLQCRL